MCFSVRLFSSSYYYNLSLSLSLSLSLFLSLSLSLSLTHTHTHTSTRIFLPVWCDSIVRLPFLRLGGVFMNCSTLFFLLIIFFFLIWSIDVDSIIRFGIRKFTDSVGTLWVCLAEYYIRMKQLERARGNFCLLPPPSRALITAFSIEEIRSIDTLQSICGTPCLILGCRVSKPNSTPLTCSLPALKIDRKGYLF